MKNFQMLSSELSTSAFTEALAELSRAAETRILPSDALSYISSDRGIVGLDDLCVR